MSHIRNRFNFGCLFTGLTTAVSHTPASSSHRLPVAMISSQFKLLPKELVWEIIEILADRDICGLWTATLLLGCSTTNRIKIEKFLYQRDDLRNW
jgi:hypothetical protein